MTSELTKAHCKFIQEIGTIEQKGNNPFHNSKYATLEGVLSVVNPVLAANGLSVSQTFDHTAEGRSLLKTHLKHISGEELISSALYPDTSGKNKLHDWGGNCTYMRRYTLLAILGICAGIEDTDGNHANPQPVITKPKTNTPTQKQQKPTQDITIKNPPLDPQKKDQLMDTLASLHQTNPNAFAQFDKAYRSNYSKGDGTIRPEDKISDHIQEPKHAQFVEQWIAAYMK